MRGDFGLMTGALKKGREDRTGQSLMVVGHNVAGGQRLNRRDASTNNVTIIA